MTSSRRRTTRRLAWAVPVATAAVVVTAAALPSVASADPHPTLPAKTPAQLLTAVQTEAGSVRALSGTLVQTARLGLPDLPGGDGVSALSLQTLVSGTHTARVWFDGTDRQRLALLGSLSESDVVHNGRDVWTYESSSQKVSHGLLPAEPTTPDAADEPGDVSSYTPQGAARDALAAIDPSTKVTVDRTARVAGRPAYTLVLTPRDARSTVRRVAIAVDAARSVPLRVQVFGRGAAPAFEVTYTDISFRTPAASVFAFTPPAGAKVTEGLPGMPAEKAADSKDSEDTETATAAPTTVGTGWTTVVAVPASKDGSSALLGTPGGKAKEGSAASLLQQLTSTLPNGDRLLHTALVNALLTKDGRTFVGAVTPEVLQQAAAGKLA